jgi:RHS repeat-associated protein
MIMSHTPPQVERKARQRWDAPNFRVNSLNELTTNTNGGTLTVVGTTTSPATSVTVNASSATLYGDATFAAASLPLRTTYTAVAQDSYGRRATNTVTVSLATNVVFQYDGNGNLTNDRARSFVYDDENELIQVWVSNAWMSQFAYDGKMRRRTRQEFTWQGGAWVQTNAVYYVYDGNLVIQERDMNNLPTVTYTRGKDLSGSLEGAGGIGGLLARTSQAYQDAPLAGHSFYHCDGNGNVTMLIDSSQGIVAKYLYDASGYMLSKSGLLADANMYRFSSKEWHANSGLVYYLYRYYDPNLQGWPNRDPLGNLGSTVYDQLPRTGSFLPEAFAANPFWFAGNDPVEDFDVNGLQSWIGPAYGSLPTPGLPPAPSGPSSGCQLCMEGNGQPGPHMWVECPGGPYGFYPGPTGIWHGPGQIPTDQHGNPRDPHSSDPDKSCTPISFPCGQNCDAGKFQKCMADTAKQPPGNYCVLTHNCQNWARDAVSKCKKAACH